MRAFVLIAVGALGLVAAVGCHGGERGSLPPPPPPRMHLLGCALADPLPRIPTEDHIDHEETYGALEGSLMMGRLGTGVIGRSSLPQPFVAIGPATATGHVGATPIRRALREHLPAIASCYGELLKKTPTLRGGVVASFAITADGKATGLVATGRGELAACVTSTLASLAFGRPPAAIAAVAYPFAFDHGPSAPSSLLVDDAATTPWTPYAALDRELDDEHGETASRAAEAAIKARMRELDACFGAGSATGSMRAMLSFVHDGALTEARVGGLGDAPVERCVAEVLGDLYLVVPPGGYSELACDLGRGDARPWRVSPEPYQRIDVTATTVRSGELSITASDGDPEPLPAETTYLVVVDPAARAAQLGLALQWAAEGTATLIATRDGHGLAYVGVGRNTASVDEAENETTTPHPSVELRGDTVTSCVDQRETHAKLADPSAVETMLRGFAAYCRRRACATTVGIAHDPEVSVRDVATVAALARRVGFQRVMLGAFSRCHVP
ncbi:MAG: AgmX/PglI C-terminal domain-containing protein [Proteobacteria bacterium]|nr:AgmX/PglI C-terminal domain-containing protein [Pseudomonadota bacterium]